MLVEESILGHRHSRQLTGVLSYQNWAHRWDDVVITLQVQTCCPAEEYADFTEMCGTHRGHWTAHRLCTDSYHRKSRVTGHQGMDCRNVNDVNTQHACMDEGNLFQSES